MNQVMQEAYQKQIQLKEIIQNKEVCRPDLRLPIRQCSSADR